MFSIKQSQQKSFNNLNHFNNNVDKYIKLLLSIFYNYEYINNKAIKKFERNQQFEICYIVNQKYIKKLKQILNYKEFCNHKIKGIFN